MNYFCSRGGGGPNSSYSSGIIQFTGLQSFQIRISLTIFILNSTPAVLFEESTLNIQDNGCLLIYRCPMMLNLFGYYQLNFSCTMYTKRLCLSIINSKNWSDASVILLKCKNLHLKTLKTARKFEIFDNFYLVIVKAS